MESININPKASYVLETLQGSGKMAYLVGGCVRNSILNEEAILPYAIKDWDIATNATPDEMKSIFNKVILTGEKHGTVTVMVEGEPFEVTTFRKDGVYLDGRRPDSVTFIDDLKEDLARRDFTMNAIAYSPAEGYIDYFNGISDIQMKRIKAVGNPEERIKEDPLRIMRAIRFLSQFNFQLDESLFNIMTTKSHLINAISKERIQDELNKILLAPCGYYGIRFLLLCNVMGSIFPELLEGKYFYQHNPHHQHDVLTHNIETYRNVFAKDIRLALAALLHDVAKPYTFSLDNQGIGHFYGHAEAGSTMAMNMLKRLRYSNQITKDVGMLIKYHMPSSIGFKKNGYSKVIEEVGVDNLPMLFDLMNADSQDIKALEDRIYDFLSQKEVPTRKMMQINGNDLIALGIPAGRTLGTILDNLFDGVVRGEYSNSKEELKEAAIAMFQAIR